MSYHMYIYYLWARVGASITLQAASEITKQLQQAHRVNSNTALAKQ